MNKLSHSLLAILGIIALLGLSGCGVRKKSLLLRLSPGNTTDEVRQKLGTPDEIDAPLITSEGDVVDIWKYNLATVDEAVEGRRSVQQIVGWLVFWPLLCFPSTWESPYSYDMYMLKFVNNLLIHWGKISEFRFPLIQDSELYKSLA